MAGPESFPYIRLEIDHMKHALMVALSEYQAKFDSELQSAVDAYFEPENIRRVVAENVKRTIDEAIRRELDSCFKYGDGAGLVREVVNNVLEKAKLEDKP